MPAKKRAAPRPRRPDAVQAITRDVRFRSIGPYRGGRVGAVSGDPVDRQVFYFGSTGGGVWKTTDGGIYWENVSDGFFKRASVGALAVAPSDPNVIYVGMGESCIRGNVSHGDGVYRSTDAGKTWSHLGLADTRNIAQVRVHPQDPDTAYVAALGHAHGPNRERGLFRTRDGGRTWKRILYRDERTGAIDVSMDPRNPRILYCALWQAIRRPWELVSGGPGSGIFKSTDGGDTWKEITRAKGLPAGVLGKIGVVASAARADRVFAIVEAADGAVFRSDDGGESWERGSEDRNLRQRAWYYHHIFADPKDADTVYVLNVEAWRSTDAGATFARWQVPHGDNHDLWIDPADPRRMIEGNDGGATVTFNGGESWSSMYNQPTAEFYHVTTDTRVPYRVYGSQQDNTSMSVPSRAPIAGITRADAYQVGGGEAGYIQVHPRDPDVIYAGEFQGIITRYDHRTGQARNIMIWPEFSSGWGAKDLKYRFQWTYPIHISPHDPSVIYIAGDRVFRTTDEGASWEAISPDLTRNDPGKLGPSGGPITKDNTGAEYYCTIFAFAESPRQPGVLWAGSDDGLVHLSRDGGATWKNVTPRGLPAWTLISIIEPSPHDAATAYLAATRYKLDDFRPMLFKTSDHGRTWTRITAGIPNDDFTRVIREDPERRGLLYAGTETGVYVSFDAGRRWHRLRGQLPAVPIHDMVVKDGDLVLATHGRSFWILDDLSAFRQWAPAAARGRAHLFAPRAATRFMTHRGFAHPPTKGRNYRMTGATMVTYRVEEDPLTETKMEVPIDAGRNPADGVLVQYLLRRPPEGEVTLSFRDSRGREIRTFTSKKQRPQEEAPPETAATPREGAEAPARATPSGTPEEEEEKEPRVPKEAGLNRFVWDMRCPPAVKVAGDKSMEDFERALAGPIVAPGTYQVRLRAGGETHTAELEVPADPRTGATQRDLDEQFALLLRIRDLLSQTHESINAIRDIRGQVQALERRARGRADLQPIARAAAPLLRRLAEVEEELIQTRAQSRQDTLNFPIKLNAKLAGVAAAVASADAGPTEAQRAAFADVSARIERQLARLRVLREKDLARFDGLVKRAAALAVSPRPTPRRRRRT